MIAECGVEAICHTDAVLAAKHHTYFLATVRYITPLPQESTDILKEL